MHEFCEIDFSEEDREVKALAGRIADERIAPDARVRDETEAFPHEAMAALGEAGLLGILIPERFGGAGGSMLQYCLALEEVARVCGATAATFMTQVHGMLPILLMGDDRQRERWLPEAATGRRITSLGITEPGAGSDLAAIQTTARATTGGYVVSGQKMFITNGSQADLICVFARTHESRYDGLSIFVVETDAPGLTYGPPLKKMGIRSSETSEVFFDEVVVPQDHRLGPEGVGFRTAMGALGDARISTAAQACGLARGAWDRAYAYAHERVQFGQPIYEFQAVQIRLMELFSKLCSARLMLYQLARLIDSNAQEDYAVEASMAKSYCSDVAMDVTSRCVDVLGGYGYMREYEVERFMRDAKITQIYDGTNDINRLVMARQMDRRRSAGG